MATGRDATDVALSTSFGAAALAGFRVVTEEVTHAAPHPPGQAEGVHPRPCEAAMPPAARISAFAEALPATGG
jgi:hypothetical protein